MRVKICGITNIKDALDACESGADALGFVFYEKSPRYIKPKDAAEIIRELPPFVQPVGLFVNLENILEICREASISMAQLHFDNAPKNIPNLQTVRVVRAQKLSDILQYPNEYKLVDSFVESYGGDGKRVAIEWFENIDVSKIVLAGGLTPKNVEPLKNIGFYGFDVSSGVEISPGKKDKLKMQDFINAVKA
ncbi:MAG: phosphoribosylanthranilate isomerase [Pseudomonadota bacterium]|jgi:phosphoribosylanthranilate isomerase